MARLPRKVYTYEFKMEAVRLVESGQSIAEAARSLGVIEQTLSNWMKAHRAGKLTAVGRVTGDNWNTRATTNKIPDRIDSLLLLPVRTHCLMKMLPVRYASNGQQEATERGKQAGADRSGSDALSEQHTKREGEHS
jgi:transposase